VPIRFWRALDANTNTIMISTIAPAIRTPFCCSIPVRSVVPRFVLEGGELVIMVDISVDVLVAAVLLLVTVDDSEEVVVRLLLVVTVVAAAVIGTESHGLQVEPSHPLW
jgi:hypothetical protein